MTSRLFLSFRAQSRNLMRSLHALRLVEMTKKRLVEMSFFCGHGREYGIVLLIKGGLALPRHIVPNQMHPVFGFHGWIGISELPDHITLQHHVRDIRWGSSRGDRFLSHRSRYTQVPVPATRHPSDQTHCHAGRWPSSILSCAIPHALSDLPFSFFSLLCKGNENRVKYKINHVLFSFQGSTQYTEIAKLQSPKSQIANCKNKKSILGLGCLIESTRTRDIIIIVYIKYINYILYYNIIYN